MLFGWLQIVPNVLAQSEFTEPKFSVGYSLGLPSSLHLFIRDIGIQDLGVRTDVGGDTVIIVSYFQTTINLEYHSTAVGDAGFFGGVGLIGQKILTIGEFASPTVPPWMLGFQTYVGFEISVLFVELGFSKNFLNLVGWGDFLPRVVVGSQLYF